MAIESIETSPHRAWTLWKITEDEAALRDLWGMPEEPPVYLTHPQKRLEWYTGRIAIRKSMEALGLSFTGLVKDEFGKPYPAGHAHQLSVSHSYPYVAAVVDVVRVGIDLEQPKDKLLRIAPRVLHANELANAGTDLVKHCIYWCAKEALIKFYGKKDLTLAEHLIISPFERQNEGDIVGRIIVKHTESVIPLYYRVYPNFVVAFTK
jgi:phosphopantetheinyl transferase